MSAQEIKALLGNKRLTTRVKFLDGRECTFDYHTTFTVQEAIETIAEKINLANFSTFSLYEVKQAEVIENGNFVDVHQHLEENLYIADILARQTNKDEPLFLFKKRMFR